jgi:hypothetical protein
MDRELIRKDGTNWITRNSRRANRAGCYRGDIEMINPMLFICAFLLAAATACTQRAVTPADSGVGMNPPGSKTAVPATQQGDWAAIEKLEGEAKTIARTAGCTASGDCKAAPVGSRACGGPRYYLPYCAKTTDSVSLLRKLDEVARAEQAYNRKYNLASTCEFRMPPTVTAVGGSCVAQ